MIISAIAAIGKHRGIGNKGQLPWHIPSELKHFKETTMGHHLIMGRKTFQSHPKPLPGRTSIVISRQKLELPAECFLSKSLEEALKLAKDRGESEVFITGGAEIFHLAFPQIEQLYLTVVDYNGPADTFFPNFNWSKWEIADSKKHKTSKTNPIGWDFFLLTRK
jgi:dihydrofolate reductase